MFTSLKNDQEIISFLANTSLFKYADPANLSKIIPYLAILRPSSGEILMKEGEPGNGLYLVKCGQLSVCSYDAQGQEIFLSHIRQGESVGEISLLTGGKRTATVRADTDSELLFLSCENFEHFEEHHPDEAKKIARSIDERLQQNQIYNALKVSQLLGDLNESLLNDLVAELERIILRGGDVLVREGEPSDAMFIIISGGLRVVSKQNTETEISLLELGSGQTVGEVGIVTGELRSATVYATRDTVLARLPVEGFNRLLEKHPKAMTQHVVAKVISRLQGQIKGTVRVRNDTKTLAVISVNPGFPLTAFAKTLAQAMSAIDSTTRINSSSVDDDLSKPGLSHVPDSDPASGVLLRWLADQETQFRYLIYETDNDFTRWTERCLRQADHILLVGDGALPPDRDRIAEINARLPVAREAIRRSLVLVHAPEVAQPSGTEEWLKATQVDAHYHVRQGSESHFARLARLITGNGVGVVMSGGGARGFAHLGVLRALNEAGIPIDLIGGTSQGGVMACQYAMGWDFPTIMEKNYVAIQHKFDYTFPITALMAGGEMTDAMQEMFEDARLEDMWLPCFCITASLFEGEIMVHNTGPVWKYTRATTSLPGILPPVINDQQVLVDGGLLNNLPTDVMRARKDVGAIFALDVSFPKRSSQKRTYPFESRLSGWGMVWNRLNPFAKKQKVPTIGQILSNMTVIGSLEAGRKARTTADFYIPISAGTYGLLEFKAIDAIVENGYQSAMQAIEEFQNNETFKRLVNPLLRSNHQTMKTTSKQNEQDLPPMVKGLPFIGNTVDALKNVVDLFNNAYTELGPVFRISRFKKQVYVLAGLKANYFYLDHEDEFLTTKGIYENMLREGGSHHTFIGLDGAEHHNLRRQMQSGFSRQQIASQVPDLIRYVQQIVEQWPEGHVFDAMTVMSQILMEQAGTSMLNHSLTQHVAEQIGDFCKTFVGVGAGIQPEILLKLPSYQRGKRLMTENMEKIYDAHQATPAGSSRPFDLMDTAASVKYLNGETMNRQDVIGNSFYPFVMNSVYTNRTTNYLIYELLKNPEAMKRVMTEIDAVLAEGSLSLTALQRMPILRAAIKEALRLYPIFSAIPRIVKKSFEFEGYTIPEGQKIYVAGCATHFFPEFFPDPYKFDLDRFLPPRNEHHQPRVYGPFGLGRHSCLGSNLTEVFIQTTVIGLLGSLNVEIFPATYTAKRVANPLPGPEGFKLRVMSKRKQPAQSTPGILADEDMTLLLAGLNLDKSQLVELMSRITRKTYAAGEVIIQQGEEADAFYMLMKGAVDICLKRPDRSEQHLNQLHEGSFFGEIGLLHGVPRVATVQVSENAPAEVLVIDRDTFEWVVAEYDLTAAEISAIVNQRLINLNLAKALPTLTKGQIAQAVPDTVVKRYRPGETIIRQGDVAETFYILTKGRVEVLNHIHNGQEIIIDGREVGEYFGEIGILHNRPRTATVRAAPNEEVEALAIGRDAFLNMMATSEMTEAAIAKAMSQRLCNLNPQN